MLNSGISINDINLRVVIYARVSTDHKEQKNSLVNQVEHFKKVIDNNLNWTYIATYIDDGWKPPSVNDISLRHSPEGTHGECGAGEGIGRPVPGIR